MRKYIWIQISVSLILFLLWWYSCYWIQGWLTVGGTYTYGPYGPHPPENEIQCGGQDISPEDCEAIQDCVYVLDHCIYNTKG